MEDKNKMDDSSFELGFTLDAEYVSNQQAFMDEDSPIEVNIWLESLDDKRVWAPLFDGFPKYNFNFLNSASFQSADGKSANGCNRLLKLLDSKQITLGKHQIFCLDSDFKFIKNLCHSYDGKDYSIEHIYWTFVHSKENIHMFPSLVDETISHITGLPKSQLAQRSSAVFEKFAECIFPSFTGLIFLETLELEELEEVISKFRRELRESFFSLKAINSTSKIEFETQQEWIDFTVSLSKLNAEITTKIDSLKLNTEHESYLKTLHTTGINRSNIYLFVRGHDLEDVMCGLFGLITEAYKQKTLKDIETSSASTSIYRQRRKEFMNRWINFSPCFKSRTPNFDQVPFFRENIPKIRSAYT